MSPLRFVWLPYSLTAQHLNLPLLLSYLFGLVTLYSHL
jgi:hypothetical protein